jgi:hypothetical protein
VPVTAVTRQARSFYAMVQRGSPLMVAGRSRSRRERCDDVRSGIVHLYADGSGIELRLRRAEFCG